MVRTLFLLASALVLSFSTTAQTNGLYELDAEDLGNSVKLSWRSLEGFNVLFYEIHKLNEDNDWELVRTVDNDPDTETWRIEDETPLNGLNSYRLKAQEVTGQPHYSDVEEVYFQPLQFDVMIYPNPANNWIVVNADKKNAGFQAELVNRYGHTVLTSSAKNGSIVLDTSAVIEGLYYIKINGGSVNYNKSVVINHR